MFCTSGFSNSNCQMKKQIGLKDSVLFWILMDTMEVPGTSRRTQVVSEGEAEMRPRSPLLCARHLFLFFSGTSRKVSWDLHKHIFSCPLWVKVTDSWLTPAILRPAHFLALGWGKSVTVTLHVWVVLFFDKYGAFWYLRKTPDSLWAALSVTCIRRRLFLLHHDVSSAQRSIQAIVLKSSTGRTWTFSAPRQLKMALFKEASKGQRPGGLPSYRIIAIHFELQNTS